MSSRFFHIEPSGLKFPVKSASCRGAALVTVLCILVLMAALIVMFLSAVGTERRAASAFGAGASARQLADLAVNIVQGQIHEATSGGITNTWASQPGMIRTFNSAGNLAAAYKLYSAGTMVAGAVSLTEDLPPADWKSVSGLWTDLNDPVRLAYSLDNTTNRPLVYPILDPRAENTIGTVDPVAGFDISSPPGGNVTIANAAPGNNPAPMPVRWLYVLQNGRLAVPSSQTGGVVSFSGADVPSAANPIVGRVAFWTDDETCKVNLNTAGEGTYWDTPRMTSTDDVRMAFYQPTRNEWQRYPGHPGTTSLSAVFPWRNLPSTGSGTPSELVDTQARQAREAVRRATEISPVYRFGGSEAGTRAWLYPMGTSTDEYFQTSNSTLPRKRLYTSLDELMFDDDTDASSGTRSSTNRLFQGNQTDARAVLESRRFFLTAHSRAPETSLFNLPRVAIWPVFKLNGTNFNMNRTTAFDRQIARTATINGKPYFFQRENALSTNDLSSIDRNGELLSYLDQLTSRNVPGFGGAFSSKYAQADRRQLLVSIYDYIRSANLFDEYLYVGNPTRRSSTNSADQWAFTLNPGTGGQTGFNARPGHGLVVPTIYDWEGVIYKGFGRFPTISEFGFHLIATADGSAGRSTRVSANSTVTLDPEPDKNTDPDAWYRWRSNNAELNFTLPGAVPPATRGIELSTNHIRVQAMPLIELFDPMQGFTQLSPGGGIRISGLRSLLINSQNLYGQDVITLRFGNTSNILHQPFDQFAGSGFLGFRFTAMSNLASLNDRGALVSNPVTVQRNGPLDFSAGRLKLEILAPNSEGSTPDNDVVLQTIEIDFPSGVLPVPRLVTQSSTGVNWNWNFPETQQINSLVSSPAGMTYPEYGNVGPSSVLPPERFWSFANNELQYDTDTTAARNMLSNATTEIQSNTKKGGRLNLLSNLTGSFRRWKYPGIPGAQGSGALILENFDVVRTVYSPHGDFRLLDASAVVPPSVFQMESAVFNAAGGIAHTLREAGSTGHAPGFFGQSSYSGIGGSPSRFRFADLPPSYQPGTAVSLGGFSYHPSITGDWDSGFSVAPDGPFINKPDEGNTYKGGKDTASNFAVFINNIPYFFLYGIQEAGFTTFSSPNRILASPGMFGSLPTGVKSGIPWRTLLFRPQAGHPGQASPADHLMLDLFWMPVVEPYAISEPFSTAGKINLNYQILPFTYIERSTGIQAVLVNERLGAVPNAHAPRHKVSTPNNITEIGRVDSSVLDVGSTRRLLNLPAILQQFQRRFDSTNIFRSASEICSIHMVPVGENPTAGAEDAWATTFWANNRLTGENIRERIYTTVYPRVTTKSNTFTVHVRSQALKQAPGGTPAVWDEARGAVEGDYRGSTTLERFIDPNNTAIPDYAAGFGAGVAPLDSFYRWRVVQNRQFAP